MPFQYILDKIEKLTLEKLEIERRIKQHKEELNENPEYKEFLRGQDIQKYSRAISKSEAESLELDATIEDLKMRLVLYQNTGLSATKNLLDSHMERAEFKKGELEKKIASLRQKISRLQNPPKPRAFDTEEKIAEAMRLRLSGMTVEQLGGKFAVSGKTVSKVLDKENLKIRYRLSRNQPHEIYSAEEIEEIVNFYNNKKEKEKDLP